MPVHAALSNDLECILSAFDNSCNIIFIKDENLRIVYANEQFMKLFAPEQRSSLIGTTTFENFPEREVEGFLKEDKAALYGEKTEIIEEVTDYKGEIHILKTNKTPFNSPDNQRMLLGISVDITAMAEKEKILAKRNIFLEKFLSVAAHDLRSPLSNLVSLMSIVEIDKGNSLTDESKGYLNHMKESAITMMNQVASLIDINKAKSEQTYERCDLNDVIKIVKMQIGQSIAETNTKLLTNYLPQVDIKKEHAVQLIQNLVENSIKYRSQKPPLIIIKAEHKDDFIQLIVEDNGKGIKPETRLFQLMHQEDISYNGAGLGLALCEKIVEWYKGTITVDRDYDQGLRIIVNLPIDNRV